MKSSNVNAPLIMRSGRIGDDVGVHRAFGLLDQGHDVAHARGCATPCDRGETGRSQRVFSPVEANTTGRPTTPRAESTAPPRAS
jgi:hypothetical protein